MAFFHHGDEETIEALITPIMALRKMKHPTLSFAMYHDSEAAEDAGYLCVQVSTDDKQYELLSDWIKINDATGETGWKTHTLSLEDYGGSERLFVALVGANNNSASVIAIDNIQVYDDLDCDLAAVSIVAPESLRMNETSEFAVEVENKGLLKAGNYTVELYADGVKTGETAGLLLSPGERSNLKIATTPNAAVGGRNVEYKAVINYSSDQNELNDAVSLFAEVVKSGLPQPENLTGSPSADKISMTWDAPQTGISESITDSFEDYEAFSIEKIGDWTLVDVDKRMCDGIANQTYPNMDTARAYQVWRPGDLKVPSAWNPYSGEQCLISFAAGTYYPDGTYAGTAKNDDWLISPHIIGGTTVKFFAGEASSEYGHESFEFLVSYGTGNIEDFTPMEAVKLEKTGWSEFSFELPADATYFAIRCTSDYCFALMIDDITYTPGYSDLELLGYNVYRNGELLTASPVSESAFLCDFDENFNVYGVSAVYTEGESPLTTISYGSGIDSQTKEENVTVYGAEGCIVVNNAAGMSISVYTPDGVRMAMLNGSDNNLIAAERGICLVSVGNKTYKVIVK